MSATQSNVFETSSATAHAAAAALSLALSTDGLMPVTALRGAIVANVQALSSVYGETARIARAAAAHYKAGSDAAVLAAVSEARKVCDKARFNSWLTGFKTRMAEVGVGYSPKQGGRLWLITAPTAADTAPTAPAAPAIPGNGAPHGDKAKPETDAERSLRERNIALSARIRELEAAADAAEKQAAAAEKRAAAAEMRAAKAESFASRALLAESLIRALAAYEDATRVPVAPRAPRSRPAPRMRRAA